MKRFYIFLIAITLAVVVGFWGCDRLNDTPNGNLMPEVEFVNVPLDSTEFNYAPVVYWSGYDPDGLVSAYQYHDDYSDAAVAAYQAGDTELEEYIAGLDDSEWVTTQNTQETIYLLTETGEITEHVFMIRCIDDQGGRSSVKVRTFFRTNQAPYAPTLRWVLGEEEFVTELNIEDTLFWGDRLTSIYGGVQFLWTGSDPDDRALNIIPLEFSHLLINVTTGDTVPYPVYDDSLNLIGWEEDWSLWEDRTQRTYYGLETGNYEFMVRVRDDGLTESDTIAIARFYAIRPTFARQLLIVDENKPLSAADPLRGGRDDQEIVAFYEEVIPEAFALANTYRPFLDYQTQMWEPEIWNNGMIPYEGVNEDGDTWVEWFTDAKEVNPLVSIPYSLIHQFKWIWIIDDDNVNTSDYVGIADRQAIYSDYLDVGGQIMISGRRVFNGSWGMAGELGTHAFFTPYFGLSNIHASLSFTSALADFGGASSSRPVFPPLVIDSTVMQDLRFGTSVETCLPEIDYFGRSGIGANSFSETFYNYVSCTADTSVISPYVTNVDCDVYESRSSPSQAVLIPAHDRIINVTRVYNVTKDVFGEFMYIESEADPDSLHHWLIVISTPADSGMWTTDDLLEVDYTYIPIAPSHDNPVASFFGRFDGQTTIIQETGEIRWRGVTLFRTSLYSFPFSFLDTTPVDVFVPNHGDITVNPVAMVICNQIVGFNQTRLLNNY